MKLKEISSIKTITICLLLINLLSLCSLYSGLHQEGELKKEDIFYKQLAWILISWFILIIFAHINYRYYFDFAFILYGLNILLLIAVIIFGKTIMGAQRWFSLMGLKFQPSELSKVVSIILTARLLSEGQTKNYLRGFLFPFIFVAVTALLIFKQPDLGTALVCILIFFMIGIFSKIKKSYFISFIVAATFLSPLGWHFLKDYQKKRIIVFLNPNVDPLGSGYSIIQSKIAIGSGKILGKGFLSGTQNQFNFLPERHTDFIFTVVAEEWGFAGCFFLLYLYWLILSKMLEEIVRFKDNFSQLLSLGITSLFFLHIFINIGMTLGILPVVGIPLLFLSYGGSHILISFILLGIFFNVVRSNY